MAKGFTSLDQQLGLPREAVLWCDIIQIDFGHRTDWILVAEYDTPGGTLWLTVDKPVSHRVHDERELLAYWNQREAEGAPVSASYEIETSAYLDELREGLTGLVGSELRHFLIGGLNICLEVIATTPPQVHTSPPSAKSA
jgi:hypothetical protein